MAEGYTLLEELDQATAVNANDKLYAVKENGDDVKVSVNQLKTFVTPPDADSLTPGIVNTDTQAFSGRKTFNSGIGTKDVTVVEDVTAGGSVTATGEVHGSNIPSTATAENPLADQEFVNSSIATNTANFCGTFNSLEELEAYEGEKTNNDYAFVIGADEQGNTRYARYKYTGSAWEFEYYLNNSSFTAEQWAAIQSGITAELVALIGQASGSSPIGTLAFIMGEGSVAGWLACNEERELLIADYPKLWERVQNLPAFQSENEGYFKLPDLSGRVAQGATLDNPLGRLVEAGLPNIEGRILNNNSAAGSNIGGEWFKAGFTTSGALDTDSYTNNEAISGSSWSGGQILKSITFDASKSNAIYGNSDTVQMAAITGTWYIKATSTDDGIDEIIDDNTTDNGHAWSGEKINNELDTKQDVLISEGESQNIKTINGESILGAGNIPINATPQVITLDWNSVRGDTLATYIRNALDNGTYFASGVLYHSSQSSTGIEGIYKVYKSGGTLYLYTQSQTGGNTNYLTSSFTCSVHLVLFKYA